MKFLKENWGLVLLILLVLFGIFYWFQWRPYKIRKDCSWVHEYQAAVPFSPELTAEEAENNYLQAKKECYANAGPAKDGINYNKIACDEMVDPNAAVGIDKLFSSTTDVARPAIPAQPAKSWWREATAKEYSSCIRQKGL
jgi:hypothetical protein